MPTVFITGANRGLGLEFSNQYANLGWQVIACYRNRANSLDLISIAEKNDNITLYRLDVTKEEQINQLSDYFRGKEIDILIHNAGIDGNRCERLGTMNMTEWMNVMVTNTISPMLVTQSLVENLKIGKYKTIVGMTSIMASIDDNQSGGRYSYRASKAALNQVIRTLSVDLSDDKVKALAIHPGWVQTDMGGANAKISPNESVKSMIELINKCTDTDSGSFLLYDGTRLPW